MVSSILTYRRQRFSLLLFGLLAAFLLFFTKGRLVFSNSDYVLFPFLVLLLFLLRLFDDLQNHQFDQSKPNRSYTLPDQYGKLKNFAGSLTILTLALTFVIKPLAALFLAGFLFMNWLLYTWLLPKWKFRNLLPLLKYPFLSLFLVILSGTEMQVNATEAAFCLSLFPAFVLYESQTDHDFSLNKMARSLVFGAIFLPFLPVFTFSFATACLVLFGLATLVGFLFYRSWFTPYFPLLLLLLTRYLTLL